KKDVFNGDIGRINSIDEHEREVLIDYDGRLVPYDFGELDEITLAFAMTIHKCVAGYEMVAVQSAGLVPVAEVKAGQLVHTGQVGQRRILRHVNTGSKQVVRIRTRSGYTVDVSEEHPILVASDEEGPAFREAGTINPGLYACIDRCVVTGQGVSLPWIVYPGSGKPGRGLTVPAVLTTDWAWVLGVMVGDGCYRARRDGTVELTNQNVELVTKYRNCLERTGVRVSVK